MTRRVTTHYVHPVETSTIDAVRTKVTKSRCGKRMGAVTVGARGRPWALVGR